MTKNNKYQRSRCRVLDKCLRNPHKRYYIEDLIEACEKALTREYSETYSVSRRTIINDLNYMESEAGYGAIIEHIQDGKRIYYRYEDPNFSIEQTPLTDDESQKLQETILMLRRFDTQFPWMEETLIKLQTKFNIDGHDKSIIGFDKNIDIDYNIHVKLEELFQYILNQQVIKVIYQPFNKENLQWVLHPYYLKQHNNRWFLFALNDEDKKISNVALDRIVSVKAVGKKYIPTDIDFEEYFDDIIGVTIPDKPVEKILLKFALHRLPYVLSKPLHGTQIIRDKKQGIIEIDVIPNKELISQLLWFGEDVEVQQPDNLRTALKEIIKKMNQLYL